MSLRHWLLALAAVAGIGRSSQRTGPVCALHSLGCARLRHIDRSAAHVAMPCPPACSLPRCGWTLQVCIQLACMLIAGAKQAVMAKQPCFWTWGVENFQACQPTCTLLRLVVATLCGFTASRRRRSQGPSHGSTPTGSSGPARPPAGSFASPGWAPARMPRTSGRSCVRCWRRASTPSALRLWATARTSSHVQIGAISCGCVGASMHA